MLSLEGGEQQPSATGESPASPTAAEASGDANVSPVEEGGASSTQLQQVDSILDWKEDEGPHADLSERSRRYLQVMEKPTFLYRYLKFELEPEPEEA